MVIYLFFSSLNNAVDYAFPVFNQSCRSVRNVFLSEGARSTTIKAATTANDKRHRKTTHNNIRCFVVRLQYIYILQSIRTYFPLGMYQNTSYAFFVVNRTTKLIPSLLFI